MLLALNRFLFHASDAQQMLLLDATYVYSLFEIAPKVEPPNPTPRSK